MNISAVIPLVSLIIYSTLLLLIFRDVRTRVRKLFAVYLAVSVIFAFSTFNMLNPTLFEATRLSAGIMIISGTAMIISYYHFVRIFVHKTSGVAVKLGYGAVVFILTPIVAMDYIPQSISISNGVADINYGSWMYLMWGIGIPFFILSVVHLVKRYKSLNDPLGRNRVAYLLCGFSLIVAFMARNLFPPLPQYPLDHIGYLLNALLITYAIMRYKLLDIKLVIRKGLAYFTISAIITTFAFLLLFFLYTFIDNLTSTASMVAMGTMAILMALLFNPLRISIQKGVDKLFYGDSYDYRQMVLTFARRMGNVLDLDELAEAMLKPIAKALNVTQVSLLLPVNGHFNSQYTEHLYEEEPSIPIQLSTDSAIVKWLKENDKPLSRDYLDIAPEFKGLWEIEKNIIDSSGVELLLPLKSKGKLIGILGLSMKYSGSFYSNDDLALLTTLVHEAAIAVENAQLYAQAREKAQIDELTGLYNHRCFQERLDGEISRSSRFGDVFSLLFIDLDIFKAYNDIYGHLAGDEVLKEIGQQIRNSVRSIDTAFRYGGDEFTVILPQASPEDAYNVAERIRKNIEGKMDSRGISLTTSIGIASWPTDGVMREELIKAADGALYRSKESGRNRICLAAELPSLQETNTVVKPDKESMEEIGILSTIYALAATVDTKDHYTYGHSKKVSKYATEIAEAMNFPEERIATIRAAALLHDIGKIGVPDGVLIKQGQLQDEDWEAIHAHPKMGVAILKHVDKLSGCLAGILYHHERYDGSGYPLGLKGENIPLDARILAVADSYDAMTSLRVYREGKFSAEEALEELKRCAGTQFDPVVVDMFIATREAHVTEPDTDYQPASNTGNNQIQQ